MVVAPLAKFEWRTIRIGIPHGISRTDLDKVIGFVIADLANATTIVTFSISLSCFSPHEVRSPERAVERGVSTCERREVIMMKRAIIFALLLIAGLPPVAGIAFADYGPVSDGGIEAPARLDDVQALWLARARGIRRVRQVSEVCRTRGSLVGAGNDSETEGTRACR